MRRSLFLGLGLPLLCSVRPPSVVDLQQLESNVAAIGERERQDVMGRVAGFRVFRDFRTRSGHSFPRDTDRIFLDEAGTYWARSEKWLGKYEPAEDRWTKIGLDVPHTRGAFLGEITGRIWYAPAISMVPSVCEFDGKSWRYERWRGRSERVYEDAVVFRRSIGGVWLA
ncbi:MAG TPA: hypothetical protein VFV34_09825, partial [Blastocatellia bacterium]|nr:hypothetical protein [Blastocatellia bacterium]